MEDIFGFLKSKDTSALFLRIWMTNNILENLVSHSSNAKLTIFLLFTKSSMNTRLSWSTLNWTNLKLIITFQWNFILTSI